METNFFTQIAPYLNKSNLNIVLQKDGDKITASVVPVTGKDDTGNLAPLVIEGLVGEFDAGFFSQLENAGLSQVQEASGLKSNSDSFKAQGEKKTTPAPATKPATKAAPKAKAAPAKKEKAPPKPKKTEEDKKREKAERDRKKMLQKRKERAVKAAKKCLELADKAFKQANLKVALKYCEEAEMHINKQEVGDNHVDLKAEIKSKKELIANKLEGIFGTPVRPDEVQPAPVEETPATEVDQLADNLKEELSNTQNSDNASDSE